MKYLNLGCGTRFHPDWVNIDIKSTNHSIRAHDIRKNIPFPNETFDVVYHSHLLEHIPKSKAPSFLKECFRVLKPAGTIRIVVPDLEEIVQTYLRILHEASQGNQQGDIIYDWIMLELYDQTVREYSGGEMANYLRFGVKQDLDFALTRIGQEGYSILARVTREHEHRPHKMPKKSIPLNLIDNLFEITQKFIPNRERLLRFLLGNEYEFLRLGRFRSGGEIHHWMYDRYSLAQLLYQANFSNPVQRTANESAIPNWVLFNLDTEPDGSVYKPNSLFMEGTKTTL